MATSRLLSFFGRHKSPAGQFLPEFRHWIFTFATWIPAVILFNNHVGEITSISGPSMYPYFNSGYNEGMSGDLCWNSKWNPRENLQRGMIVSFRSPSHPEVVVVKRVIALEGDTVFTRSPCRVPTVQVPASHVWVEGDNRDTNKTLDSNTYGSIPLSLIQGKITHVLFPWNRFGVIREKEFTGATRVIRGNRAKTPGWNIG